MGRYVDIKEAYIANIKIMVLVTVVSTEMFDYSRWSTVSIYKFKLDGT